MSKPAAKKKRSRRAPRWYRALGGVWYLAVVALACGVGVVGNMASRSSFFLAAINPLTYLNVDPKETFGDGDGLTLMILGTDDDRKMIGWAVDEHGRQHAVSKVSRRGARADMILVARLDFNRNTITGLSIPRDTACRLPDHPRLGTKKINGFYSVAEPGQEKALQQEAVEHVLPGVKIDRTIAIDYDAFQRLVDTVGGVPVVVPKGLKGKGLQYDDNAGDLHIHLSPGRQTLDGKDAMGYVRFRHDSESDYGRQQRQKEFLSSFKGQIFHSLPKLPEIAEETKAVMGNALNDREIIALVAFARKVPPTNIKLGMLPTVERRGSSMLHVDEAKREAVMREFDLLSADDPKAVAGL